MYSNLFQQGMPANNSFGGMTSMNPVMNNGFVQNSGLNFGNVAPAKTSTSTPEEMAMIKANKKSNFSVSDEELAVYSWDLREGSNLAIEIVDPSTERVKVKYTGEEFNIIMQPVEVLNEYLKGLYNFFMTAKITDTSSPREEQKQLWTACGIVMKLLPQAYVNGQKNYNQLYNTMQNQMTAQGYQGNWGANMFNGTIGGVANYVIPDGSTMGAFQQQNMMGVNPQMVQQMATQMAQQMVAQQMANNNNAMGINNNMGMPTPSVNGGTMMGTNPFVQGGQPQMTTPTMNNTPSLNNIPMPNATAASSTPNPSIGSTTSTVTI